MIGPIICFSVHLRLSFAALSVDPFSIALFPSSSAIGLHGSLGFSLSIMPNLTFPLPRY